MLLGGMSRAAVAQGGAAAAAATAAEAAEAAAADTGAATTEAAQADPEPDEAPPMQRTASLLGVTPVQLACARAVADFEPWLLHFAELGLPRKGSEGVDVTHPILAVADGELICALPQALELCWRWTPAREQPSLEAHGGMLQPPLSWRTRGPSGQGFGDEGQAGVWEGRSCGVCGVV